jgi:septal ring factor EnvC (AmiA/AmiB activator)
LNLELKKTKGEKEFFQETSRLEKLAREDPATSVRAKSHLRLAFLYMNSRNPQLNYSRALQEMESYLSVSPAKAQKDDFQNWLAVLKELDRVRKDKKGMKEENQDLQTQIEKLRIGLKKVQEANKNLGNEVANLEEMIEKLKSLDYQMEEKRSLIK